MNLDFNKYDTIMKQFMLSQEEYEDLTEKCKNLMQILEMSFEDLGKEINLSKATVDRILNKATESTINLTLIARIYKIYNLLITKVENNASGKYKGLKTLLEEKTLTFNDEIDVKPIFHSLITATIQDESRLPIFPTSNLEKAEELFNKYKENGDFEKIIIFIKNELYEIPGVVIGSKIPGTYNFHNKNQNKLYSFQIVYDSSKKIFLLFQIIFTENEDGIIPLEQIFKCQMFKFEFISELLSYIRPYSLKSNEDRKNFEFLIEELKDYLGEKYK